MTEYEDYEELDGGLYVDFSSEEASSESRDIEPLPTGKYFVRISDVDLRESKSEKNFGKPYYAIEFTVIDDKRRGEFTGRKCWTNAMLFNPALYTISHIMKATGFTVAEGRISVPAPSELIDKELVIGGTLRGETKDKQDPSKTYAPKYEPQAFFPAEKWETIKGGGSVTGKTTSSAKPSLLS